MSYVSNNSQRPIVCYDNKITAQGLRGTVKFQMERAVVTSRSRLVYCRRIFCTPVFLLAVEITKRYDVTRS